MSITENLKKIKQSIEVISIQCGREKGSVELLAVSKTKPIESLVCAYECGQRLFGENRVDEAEKKAPQLPPDAVFHMIGHLQSNKVRKACKIFSCIQSVDSLKIAKKINTTCIELNKIMDIYIEINIADDQNKTGYEVDEVFYKEFGEIIKLSNIKVLGLMCIGAFVNDDKLIRDSFSSLKEILKKLQIDNESFSGNKLSMGMSSDYTIAIEEGSTMVRIGSDIFGSRY